MSPKYIWRKLDGNFPADYQQQGLMYHVNSKDGWEKGFDTPKEAAEHLEKIRNELTNVSFLTDFHCKLELIVVY